MAKYKTTSHLVVTALVGGYSVVESRGAVDGAVDASVEDDECEERDDDESERVGDHHVVAAVQRWARKWALYCLNSPFTAYVTRGSHDHDEEFTQPKAHFLAHPCIRGSPSWPSAWGPACGWSR